jgi:hypothetical protein
MAGSLGLLAIPSSVRQRITGLAGQRKGGTEMGLPLAGPLAAQGATRNAIIEEVGARRHLDHQSVISGADATLSNV